MGRIGEALAAYLFNLLLLPAATPEHDASPRRWVNSGQIKLTQGNNRIALRAEPEHLLVMRLVPDLTWAGVAWLADTGRTPRLAVLSAPARDASEPAADR